jgi:hypothetical protein
MTPPDRKTSRPTAGAPAPGPEDFLSGTYPEHLAGEPADAPIDAPTDLIEAWRSFEDGERQLLEGEGPLFAAGSWRPAPAIARLFAEADTANPRRDKRSDGVVGDLRHQARKSGHNPDGRGVVVAGDVDVDGLDMAGAVERARQAVLAGRLPQLAGGFIIYAARITSPDFTRWLSYEGDNPHVTHGHFETAHDPERADDSRPWNIWTPPGPAPAGPAPAAAGGDLRGRAAALRGEEGAQGPRVAALQGWLRRFAPAYAGQLAADGVWGPRTSAAVREFGRRAGVVSADGRNIGPQLARQLLRYGFRG